MSKQQRCAFRALLPTKAALVIMMLSLSAFVAWTLWSDRADPNLWLKSFLPGRHRFAIWWWLDAMSKEWKLFFPWPSGTEGGLLGFFALALFSLLAIVEARSGNLRRALVPTILICSIALLALASVLGLYPFGGHLRHQVLLLPLLGISLAILLERFALGQCPKAACCVSLLSVALVLWSHHEAKNPDEFQKKLMWSEDAELFLPQLESGDLIILDQFSWMGLFAWNHTFGTKLVNVPAAPNVDRTRWEDFDLDQRSVVVTCTRLSKIWKWGVFDSPASALRAKVHLDAHPLSRVWFYVREPDPKDGGGKDDVATQRYLTAYLEAMGLLVDTRQDTGGCWILRVRRR
jgi:hypothetical protein